MARILAITAAAIVLSVAGLVTFLAVDHGGAEANSNIHCGITYDGPTPPRIGTATCIGDFQYDGTPHSFTLVVSFDDLAPPGPNRGDRITACSVSLDGSPFHAIHYGPCP